MADVDAEAPSAEGALAPCCPSSMLAVYSIWSMSLRASSVDGKDEDDAIDVEAVVVAVVAVTMSKRDFSG